jgi:hypothetical protein
MIKYYAVIENNLVENVVVADESFVVTYEENNPTKTCVEYDEVNEDDTRVARIGEGYIDGFFVNGNQAVSLGLMTIDEAKAFGFHSGHEYREEPSQITDIVTMRQARLALLAEGKLSDVQVAIDSLQSPMKEQAQIEWEYASDVEITNPLIVNLMGVLGFTDTDLENLFIEASKL